MLGAAKGGGSETIDCDAPFPSQRDKEVRKLPVEGVRRHIKQPATTVSAQNIRFSFV